MAEFWIWLWLVPWMNMACSQDVPPCTVKSVYQEYPSLFQVNTVKLPTAVLKIIVLPNNTSAECFLNTTALAQDLQITFNDTRQFIMKALSFHCTVPTYLHLLPYDGQRYDRVVLYANFYNCTTNIESALTAASIGNTKMLGIIGGCVRNDNGTLKSPTNITYSYTRTYEHLLDAAVFSYSSDQFCRDDIMELFPLDNYPNMAEMVIGGFEQSQLPLPTNLSTKFPNLQSLEIPGNGLTGVPQDFPWIETDFLLPNNLSRTQYMIDHYTIADDLDIPSNHFRRIFGLNKNKIETIQGFAFNGYLHQIKLQGNGISRIHADAFVNVTELQHLDLSSNKLNTLPAGLFRGQKALRVLDISNNFLKTISEETFMDNVNLKYLSIANNALEHIASGAFTMLENLEFLHLEYNHLTTLDTSSFPLDSVKLKEVHLQYNPLIVLPEFVFYIRGLAVVNLQHTSIVFNNFNDYVLSLDYDKIKYSIIDSGSDSDTSDLEELADKQTVIDISFSQVTSLTIANLTKDIEKRLNLLFLHFKIVLTGNPFACDCNNVEITKYMNNFVQNGDRKRREALFDTWVCSSPEELNGVPLIRVQSEATYCPVSVDHCPRKCICYRRTGTNTTIVDCRKQSVSRIAEHLPSGSLELLYNFNTLLAIGPNAAFARVAVFHARYNTIQTINPQVFREMRQLQHLDLRSNLLATLPKSISNLKLSKVYLSNNPYICNCNTKWMKQWLLINKDVIRDWDQVTCNTEEVDGNRFVDVHDDMFVCKEYEKFDEVKHVVLPSIMCSVTGVFIVVVIILLYAFRLEAKVILFVRFGVHPFDDEESCREEHIDCLIVHSSLQTNWVMSNLLNVLEHGDYNLVVCDMDRDFVVGYSFQENMAKAICHSKRIIFLVSEDWQPMQETFAIAWAIAQDKIKEKRSNFGIIVTHGINRTAIKDKDLRFFIKKRRYVDTSEVMFADKVLYFMPHGTYKAKRKYRQSVKSIYKPQKLISKYFLNNQKGYTQHHDSTHNIATTSFMVSTDTNTHFKYHAFITYEKSDFQYAVHTVAAALEKDGINCCIPDRDFVLGALYKDNILTAINSSLKTILIVSKAYAFDGWPLFTFRAAYEKTLRDKTNHLIVIIRDGVDEATDITDGEMQYYLKNYVCLNESDKWFSGKLMDSIFVVSS